METILYPSITICYKYSFENDLFNEILNTTEPDDQDVSEFIHETIKSHLWSLEDEIYFFTQPGVMNLTFPCTTTLGGLTPGRPCKFPVTYIYWSGSGNATFTGCIRPSAMGTSKPGCFTRVYGNNTVDSNMATDDSWGYCPATCKGESTTSSSPYNLAKSRYKSLWKSDLYDFSLYSNSYCHTYDPPMTSRPDLLNRIYFSLQRPPNPEMSYIPSHDIFIHQKGQFWPRSDMISFGQPDPVTVSAFILNLDELELFFSVKEIHKISTEENPCKEDTEYSLTTCLREYALRKSKCQIDFFGEEQNRSKDVCTKNGLKLYIKTLDYLKQEDISKIVKDSGCNPKCKTTQYSYEKSMKKVSWQTNGRSEVYIQAKSSVVKYLTENYSFDFNDLISSVGGNLGLFLGWSFLTLAEALGFIFVLLNVEKYLKFK